MSNPEDNLEIDNSKEKSSQNENKDILILESEEKGVRIFFKKTWFWLKESKQKTFSLVFLLLFIAFMIFLGVFENDPTSLMLELVYWFQDKTGDIGLYIGVGVISIFGNFVMFIPVFYAAVIMFVAVIPGINVFFLGIAAGIGASIGQIASWFVGRATREVAGDKLEKQLRKTQRWVERGLAPIMIFIFAATPLPDEVLLIMIGLIGYSLGKTLIYCFIGKIVLTLSISVVANLFSTTAVGEWFLETLFGLTRTMLIEQELPAGNNIWTSIAIWIIAATLVVAVTFVDWVDIYDNFLCKKEERQLKQIFEVAKASYKLDDSAIVLNHKDRAISIQLLEEQKQEHFPEESLWFFQEKLSKKKEVFFRKSLIAIDTIANTTVDIILNKEWLENFRANIQGLKFKSLKNRSTELIKFPQKVLDIGFIVSESRLIEFQIKLKHILPEENMTDLLDKSNFKKREKRQLMRAKVNVEVLIETLSSNETKVWAIGLKEGTHINKIYKFRKVESIFYWLQLLNCLSDQPSKVKGLLILNLIDTSGEDIEITTPKDILNNCPI